jgi:hypothetical protein
MAEVRIERVEFGGWPNCYRMTNGEIELIATTDVGPRVIHLGFVNEQNLFKVFEDQLGQTGGEEWRIFGGHRLWHAPEGMPRSYYPDNTPIEFRIESENALLLRQPTETTTGMQKEILLTMDAHRNHITVRHRIYNRNLWAVEFSAWPLTVMAQGGVAIFPQEPYAPHPAFVHPPYEPDPRYLLPVRQLVLWSYTNMSDPRWYWGRKYIALRQDPKAERPLKLGLGNRQGWAAYGLDGFLFVKRVKYLEGETYPDFGCSMETFTCADFLEVETLSPIERVEPNGFIEHVEHWFLFRDVQFEVNDESIDANVLPRIKQTEDVAK